MRARLLETVQPELGEQRAPRARAPARAGPPRRSASAALSRALSHGSSRSRWGISAAGAQRTLPASGACRPQISSSSVVLPQPLGPTTASSSPRSACRETRRARARARCRRWARRRCGSRSLTLTAARARAGEAHHRCALFGLQSLQPPTAPSAGITPQVRRVGAGESLPVRHLSRPARQPPWCLSLCERNASSR